MFDKIPVLVYSFIYVLYQGERKVKLRIGIDNKKKIEIMINTLSDQQAVKNLAETITEKDEKTGQTWLKLPVENKQMVENALHLLAGFFNGRGK